MPARSLAPQSADHAQNYLLALIKETCQNPPKPEAGFKPSHGRRLAIGVVVGS